VLLFSELQPSLNSKIKKKLAAISACLHPQLKSPAVLGLIEGANLKPWTLGWEQSQLPKHVYILEFNGG
jgi:hypothetical protein